MSGNEDGGNLGVHERTAIAHSLGLDTNTYPLYTGAVVVRQVCRAVRMTIQTHTHTHTHIHTHTHTHTHTRTHARTHAHTHTHIPIKAQSCWLVTIIFPVYSGEALCRE